MIPAGVLSTAGAAATLREGRIIGAVDIGAVDIGGGLPEQDDEAPRRAQRQRLNNRLV